MGRTDPAKRRRAGKRVRIQLDLLPEEARALDALRDRCRLRSRSDAVRTALSILEWMDGERRRGRRVVSVGENDVAQIHVPGITR